MPCLTEGCKKVAVYGTEYKKPLYCHTHKLDGMTNSRVLQCESIGCSKISTFNLIGETKGRFCKAHKLDGMVDVKNKRCEAPECLRHPAYNIPGEKLRRYCAMHKEDGMVNIATKSCKHDGCLSQPIFGIPGKKQGLYCAVHRPVGTIDVKNRHCEAIGCTKQPVYNSLGESRGRFCAKHKEKTMIDVMGKHCEAAGCLKHPTYNILGETYGRYCLQHKEDGMKSVTNKTCRTFGCLVQPVYNYPKETRGLCCMKHKEDGMCDVVNKRCAALGCFRPPIYNDMDKARGRYCAEHKTIGMVYITKNRCEILGCKKVSNYRWPFAGLTHCSTHKLVGQIRKKERCACKKSPTHSLADLTEFFCFDCSRDREGLIDHRVACGKCGLKITPNYLFQEGEYLVCETCCESEVRCPASIDSPTPADVQPMKKQRIEEVIVSLLEQKIASKSQTWHSAVIELQKDKAIGSSGCDSRRRPDVYLLLAGSNYALKLIIEIDEYQHKSYSCECEQGRMLEIANEILVPGENERLVFVRLNPDSYKIKGKVKRSQRGRTEIAKRVQELDRVVQLIYERDITLEEGKHCGVAYLYYDDYNGLELMQL